MPTTTLDVMSRNNDLSQDKVLIKLGSPLLESRRKRIWVRTPGYAALRASGAVLPQNSYTYEEYALGRMSGNVLGTGAWKGQAFTIGPHGAQYNVLPAHPAVPTNDLDKILIKRAKGQQWNAPVFFAEALKTSNMVVARATHLALMANDLRRGDIPAFFKKMHHTVIPPRGKKPVERFNREYGRNAQNAAANAWLEYSYGWVPFMNDVRAAVNTLMDVSDRPNALIATVTAKIVRSTVDTVATDLIYRNVSPDISVYGHAVVTEKQSFRAKWKFKPLPLDLPGKLGLTNPMEVAWELLPFSFVADWFLPIGDYLSSLDAPLRFGHVSGTYGSRSALIKETFATSGVVAPFSGKCYTIAVRRTPMSVAPSFSFLKGLKFSTGQSGKQVTSAIALLNQQLSRLRPRKGPVKAAPEPRRNLSFPEHYEHL